MSRLLQEIEGGRSESSEPENVPHKLVIRQSAAEPSS
jgi:hypothetical protein